MKPVRLTPKADSDVDSCFLWIHKDNPSAAIKFIDDVEQTCNALAQMPSIGSRHYADIALVRGIRMIAVNNFKNYLLFFTEYETHIEVIRLLHGARDIPEILQSE
jgi:toxin ParE1/3/4